MEWRKVQQPQKEIAQATEEPHSPMANKGQSSLTEDEFIPISRKAATPRSRPTPPTPLSNAFQAVEVEGLDKALPETAVRLTCLPHG